jgi:hypothetical protein
VLSEELFKVTPTYQNGAPNTVIGPPTSGERVLGELWKDSLGGALFSSSAESRRQNRAQKPSARNRTQAERRLTTGGQRSGRCCWWWCASSCDAALPW